MRCCHSGAAGGASWPAIFFFFFEKEKKLEKTAGRPLFAPTLLLDQFTTSGAVGATLRRRSAVAV